MKSLIKLVLLLPVIIAPFSKSFGQESDTCMTDFNSKFMLRGKALVGFFLEDWYFLTATGGVEYELTPKQSLGVDYIYYRDRFERDLYDTIAKEELGHGFSQYRIRSTLLVDHRYYFHSSKNCKTQLRLYISSYIRFTRFKVRNQEGYLLEPGDIISKKARYFDPGFAFGIRSVGRHQKRFGIDFNVGITRRSQVENWTKYKSSEVNEVVNDFRRTRVLASTRLNLYFYL